jgi:hypothetical protein
MRGALVLLGLVSNGATGCSSSEGGAPPATGSTDAAAEGGNISSDAAASPDVGTQVDLDACMRERVWLESATSFTLHEDAGPPSSPGGDAGCTEGGVTFGFSLATKVLSERSCAGDAIIENKLTFTAVPPDLLALLTPLQTTCAPGCSTTPLLDLHLMVDDADAGKRAYESSAYASCAESGATGPIIRFADLRSLKIKMESLLAACSDGGMPDGGRCN